MNASVVGLRFKYRLQLFQPQQSIAPRRLIFDTALEPELDKLFSTHITCVSKCASEQDLLEFVSSKEYYLTYNIVWAASVNLDAGFKNQILVRNYINYDTKKSWFLSFDCRVKPLSNQSLIQTAELCYKSSLQSEEVCGDVMKTSEVNLSPDLFVSISKDPRTGFTADFQVKSSIRSIDGLYYCRITNRHHSIVSNFIDIENVAYKFMKQLRDFPLKYFSKIIKITDDSPKSLPCGQYAYPGKIYFTELNQSPFYWTVYDNDEDRKLQVINDEIDFVQHLNGTLEIFRFRNRKVKMTLKCKSHVVAGDFSAFDLDIDIQSLATDDNTIRVVSPLMSQVTLREGPRGIQKDVLSTIYYSNPVTTKCTWKKNDNTINSGAMWNNYNLVLPDTIDPSHAGRYSLTVEQLSGKMVVFKFDVKVVNVPRFESSLSQNIYKISGQAVDFSAVITGQSNIQEVYIDKYRVPINKTDVRLVAAVKQTHFGKKQIQLKINSVSTNLTDSLDRFRGVDDDRFSRVYTIVFVARNDLLVSRLSHVLRVYSPPKLVPDIRPSICPETANYNISYVTDTHLYTRDGLELNHMWSALDARDKSVDINRYALILNSTAHLKMNASVVGLRFKYRLQLFQPQQSNSPWRLIFDTALEPVLDKLFSTHITCVAKSEFPFWIVGLIIGIVVGILFVLFLVTCLSRNKGETYNIDKNERAMGHDPEAEFRENEIFLNYERQNDDAPIKGSQLSLTNDSVGEANNGGELDVDIDTASYSEAGSFIGQYSTNSKSSSARPTDLQKNSPV